MDEKRLTRLKAQYYIDTLWPEEAEKAIKLSLPEHLSHWSNLKVIMYVRNGGIELQTPTAFEKWLANTKKGYYENTPDARYDFNFFPRWSLGEIIQSEIDKEGNILVPQQIHQKVKLVPSAIQFKEEDNKLQILLK